MAKLFQTNSIIAMDELIDKNQIYDTRTKGYIEEVLSSYHHGNFRSAVVMLYSVVLCDLIFKLQELRDVFSDKFASDLLGKIEAKINNDKSSPEWEHIMVDEMHKKSPLLEADAYTLVSHLRDWRNLSAHPVLDDYSQLFIPEKHLVEGYICEAFTKILSKPAIFVKDIVDVMSDDLDKKKGYILNDITGFKEYVEKKYLQRMTDAMFVKVFKSFWKFTFILNNPICNSNRTINHNLLKLMLGSRKDLLFCAMDDTPNDYEITDNKEIIGYAIALLAELPETWKHLTEQTRTLINGKIAYNPFYKLIAWFLCEKKEDYIKQLLDEDFCYCPSNNELTYLIKQYKNNGLMSVLYDYFIHLLGKSTNFNDANSRMELMILPYLEDMDKGQIENVLKIMDGNRQLIRNYKFNYYCRMVVDVARRHFAEDVIKNNYKNIVVG